MVKHFTDLQAYYYLQRKDGAGERVDSVGSQVQTLRPASVWSCEVIYPLKDLVSVYLKIPCNNCPLYPPPKLTVRVKCI